MGDFHEEFIEDMKREFMGELRKKYPGQANGMRFTGNGPKSEVAGVVHRGEQVIEADMVDEAGGPGRIRNEVEKLASENERMPVEEIPMEPQQKGRLPGFQTGTGSGVVEKPVIGFGRPADDVQFTEVKKPAPVNIAPVGNEPIGLDKPVDDVKMNTVTPQTVNLDPVGKPSVDVNLDKPVDDVRTGRLPSTEVNLEPAPDDFEMNVPQAGGGVKTYTDRDEFAAATKVPEQPGGTEDTGDIITETGKLGAAALQDIVRGRSRAAEMAATKAKQELAAKHEAERQNLNQTMAQEGASPEAIRAAQGRLGASQRAESEGIRAETAIAQAERAENAAIEAAKMGMNQEQFEDKLSREDRMLDLQERGQEISAEDADAYIDLAWATHGLSADGMQLQRDKFNAWRDDMGIANAIAINNQELAWFGAGLTERQVGVQERTLLLNTAKFGVDAAIAMDDASIRKNGFLINNALAAGDFGTVNEIMNEVYGFDIDFSKIEDAEAQAQIGDGLASLLSDMEGVTDNPNAIVSDDSGKHDLLQQDLADIWNGMKGTDSGFDELSKNAGFMSWAEGKLQNLQVISDPIMGVVTALGEDSIAGLAAAAGVENLDAYEFGGKTGADAFALEYATLLFGGGITFEDGRLQIDPDAVDNLGVIDDTPTFSEARDNIVKAIQIGKSPTPEDLKAGLEVTTIDGLPKSEGLAEWLQSRSETGAFVNVDGTVYTVESNTIPISFVGSNVPVQKPVVVLTDNSGNKFYHDGTKLINESDLEGKGDLAQNALKQTFL